jgi:hypothetical protein
MLATFSAKSKAPLLPTIAVPVPNNRLPNTTTVPALLVDTVMLPELVDIPMPNEMVMEYNRGNWYSWLDYWCEILRSGVEVPPWTK